jgi:D-alanine-D-alanine ligase
MITTQQKKAFGKVAVLMGGWAAEREVSLNSGAAVLKALCHAGVDAQGIDVGRDILTVLQTEHYDRAFIVLHGRGGEDGVIQGALELMQLPYTGCGVMASAISMDKLMTKQVWMGANLPTPHFEMLQANTDFSAVVERLGLPLMVKPATEGSSIGMAKVKHMDQLEPAWRVAAQYDDQVFAEQWVEGDEYTCAILDQQAQPLIRLEVQNDFYDYEAKYQSNDTQYHCPCGLDQNAEESLQQLAQQAFSAVKGSGWGRVDMMRDQSGKTWLIEVNTVPGMTDHSLVPMAARANGISFEQLVIQILETTL